MTYDEFLEELSPFGVYQVGLLKQQGDDGDIAMLGKGKIIFPYPPDPPLHTIYRDNGGDTVIYKEVADAVYRRFSIKSNSTGSPMSD